MQVKRFSEAKPYEAPNHRGYSSLRLFGAEAGGTQTLIAGVDFPQLTRLASMLRKGPTRTRVEAIRQIVRKLQLQADEFAHVLEARDSRLRGKG